MKNKKEILLTAIIIIILLGIILPFIAHKKPYTYYDKPPFGIIDVEGNVNEYIQQKYEYYMTSEVILCVKRDIYSSNIPLNWVEKLLLKRIGITDQLTDESGDVRYELTLRTLFNIKYKKIITKKIDPLLVNKGSCR